MSSPLEKYLDGIELARTLANATEHTYRQFLAQLIGDLASECVAVNEPKRSECGAPDYVVMERQSRLTRGYIEAKDIGVSLDDAAKSEQLSRYLRSLPNLLLTDYLEFRWYVEGKHRQTIRLAEALPSGKLGRNADAYEHAQRFFLAFLGQPPVKLSSAEDLAKRLARLTHLVRDVIIGSFQSGNTSRTLIEWRKGFADTLLPELGEPGKEVDFADMFAQTLAYGLFSARVMSEGAGKFTREKAQRLIPPTNEFLRRFFYLITGPELDGEPFAPFVEDIVQTLDHTAMEVILEDFGQRRDPIVHFYETFLAAYDPKLRELRGVYYTPEPVVGYIVRSVDWILREKFALKDGLADSAKFTHTREEKGETVSEECHRVLILDPATGTATFLYEVIKFIRERFEKAKNRGQWESYVRHHLIPRIFGFELLMASYAVAHFKLGLQLFARDLGPLFQKDWAYHFQPEERLNIYLTNTLEDMHRAVELIGPGRFLSDEANKADDVKRRKPVLVVMGNPPYSGHSANNGDWVKGLIRDYYQCDGAPLGERNPKWLQDDYVKFIRWAQWRIEQTGQGVLAFITNNGYLDNPTFRGMRQHLMQSFDEIYLLDLHGNSKKKELIPGTEEQDKNVFDIQQGVAIGIFVKLPTSKRKKDSKCVVRHHEIWGKRRDKYDWLNDHSAKVTEWTVLEPDSPKYLFIPQDEKLRKEHERGWKITEVMPVNSAGIVTARDALSVHFSKDETLKTVRDFIACDVEEARRRYELGKDVRDWSVEEAQADVRATGVAAHHLARMLYRPFDERWTFYTGRTRGFHCMPRPEVMGHFFGHENVGLIATRQTRDSWAVFTTSGLAAHKSVAAYDINTVFPLYIYPNAIKEDEPQALIVREDPPRRANLASKFTAEFAAKLGLRFIGDGAGDLKKTFGPEDVFHYAYAVFHSPGYRARYAEFLRMDFPRLPLTADVPLFRKLAAHGADIAALHLLRKDGPDAPGFPVPGPCTVDVIRYIAPGDELPVKTEGRARDGRVYINPHQYFDGVPPEAWAFPIGGYLPAQKWLKDRKARALSYEEQSHYPRLVAALSETGRLMGEVDRDIEAAGGWPLK